MNREHMNKEWPEKYENAQYERRGLDEVNGEWLNVDFETLWDKMSDNYISPTLAVEAIYRGETMPSAFMEYRRAK